MKRYTINDVFLILWQFFVCKSVIQVSACLITLRRQNKDDLGSTDVIPSGIRTKNENNEKMKKNTISVNRNKYLALKLQPKNKIIASSKILNVSKFLNFC